jgi:outer membrane protease
MEVLRSVTGEASGMMKDSDWDDLENRELLTIYSESHCRLEPSYLVTGEVDLRVGDWLGLPPRFDLRPVAGIRWQRFVCIAHDGLQVYPASGGALAPLDLSGHTLRFEQVYWHHFLGLKASWDMGRLWVIPRLVWRIQGDWALVEGVNEDWHMLRLGRRITQERTRGDAWHALAGVKMGLTRNLHVCVEADYLRILTTGSHRLFNPLFDLDYSFEYGVKVWSEQMGLTMSLEWTV